MPGVKIVTDSACDLPADLVTQYDISVVPLSIRFGEEEFVDRRDLTPAEFWDRCAKSAVLPETAAPAPGAFDEVFRAAAEAGFDGVLCINLSGKLSATGQAATTAAQGLSDVIPVRLVDSRSITLGLGLIVLEAARLAAEGADLETVATAAEGMVGRTHVLGTIDTLENLKKGGRIGAAQALMGSLLSIKPLIEVRDGAVEPGPKQRTRGKALRYLVEKVTAEPAVERLAVMHGAAPDLDQLLDLLAPHFPRDEIVVADIGPVIGTHAGPRSIGVAYQVK